MSKLWNFISKALTSGSNASSKRLNGTYGFAVVQVLVIFVVLVDMTHDGTIDSIVANLIKADMYTCASLIGLGILDKFKQV